MPKNILHLGMLSVGLALLYVVLFAITANAPSRVADKYTYPVREVVHESRFDNSRNDEANQERATWHEATSDLIFYQKSDWLLDIGGLSVLPGFPAESGELTPMTWIGDPAPGDWVRLTYWVIDEKPNFVYGVRLEALSSRSSPVATFDTSLTPTAVPTLAPALCEPVRPESWVLYRVTDKDTLSLLANRSGVPIATILRVNCRSNPQLAPGIQLFLPAVPGVTTPNIR